MDPRTQNHYQISCGTANHICLHYGVCPFFAFNLHHALSAFTLGTVQSMIKLRVNVNITVKLQIAHPRYLRLSLDYTNRPNFCFTIPLKQKCIGSYQCSLLLR